MWKTAGALAVALFALIPAAAGATGDDGAAAIGLGRIRTADARIGALVAEGAERSVTLRDLMARISRTRWLVFVQRARCPDPSQNRLRSRPIGPPACLVHRVGTYEGYPYLLVRVDSRYAWTPDQEISLIAHELQHAVEAAEAAGVIDSQTLREFFRRHSEVSFQTPGLIGYETSAAVRTGRQVLHELRRCRSSVVHPSPTDSPIGGKP